MNLRWGWVKGGVGGEDEFFLPYSSNVKFFKKTSELHRSLLILTESHFQGREPVHRSLSCSLTSCLPPRPGPREWALFPVLWAHWYPTAVPLRLARKPCRARISQGHLLQSSALTSSSRRAPTAPHRRCSGFLPSVTNTLSLSLYGKASNYTDFLRERPGVYSFLFFQNLMQENAINVYELIH